jgi:hypothetical protein
MEIELKRRISSLAEANVKSQITVLEEFNFFEHSLSSSLTSSRRDVTFA